MYDMLSFCSILSGTFHAETPHDLLSVNGTSTSYRRPGGFRPRLGVRLILLLISRFFPVAISVFPLPRIRPTSSPRFCRLKSTEWYRRGTWLHTEGLVQTLCNNVDSKLERFLLGLSRSCHHPVVHVTDELTYDIALEHGPESLVSTSCSDLTITNQRLAIKQGF
jgi:hypothetical protein